MSAAVITSSTGTPETVTLDDKYVVERGRVYLTGVQALVRLPLMQQLRDAAAGLDTAAFISGYRGSPLGGVDKAFWEARPHLDPERIVFEPGLNEDLAATAVWGSQQVGLFPGAKHDGVFAFWYGKGPGVDRCGDVFKHANAAGSAALGGVLLLAGDDHASKSSTLPHQSEYAFVDASIPVLNPADVQEILDFGLIGIALSRYSGCWVAMKAIAEAMDSSASVAVSPDRVQLNVPEDFVLPEGGLNIRWPDAPLEQERRLMLHKLDAVRAFARANNLDRAVIDGPKRRLGIVTTGKSYLDVRQALADLGLDEAQARAIGLSLYKVGLTWPLEPEGIRRFAAGLDEILVVEEKRGLIEGQLRELLYDLPEARRPRILGKRDEAGSWLLPSTGELSITQVTRALAGRIGRFHTSPRMEAQLAFLAEHERRMNRAAENQARSVARVPFFCSGCPHNTSTRVPEGSRAVAGIGCHYMVTWIPGRNTETFTQMGGEGVPWIGQAPFTETKHIFANLGDGTYNHSGILAIRAAIAAKVNITYKILFNDAVAMTGGQTHDGGTLTVPGIARQLAAEDVARIVVVTDEPEKYLGSVGGDLGLPPQTPIHHRRELDAVQRELREIPGTTILIYDQTCATEKRRRRKRGTMPAATKRAFINEAVCEGCGDCSTASNCLSVVPVETPFGRKRAIDQSSCNRDFSCVEGFCPSFVTVEGGSLRKAKPKEAARDTLPLPTLPALDRPYGILVAGVGGTGVVTIGALLGMAAHLEGRGVSVLDMTGLAQKGGAVFSHIRLAAAPQELSAARLSVGGADLLLGCDMLTAAMPDALLKVAEGKTRAVVNEAETITGGFIGNPDLQFPTSETHRTLEGAVGAGGVEFLAATGLATALLGDAIAANPFMLGYAWQKGLVPLRLDSLHRAIELNGTAVSFNLAAFDWGRRAALDLGAVMAAAWPKPVMALPETLESLIARRVQDLTAYQDAAYADRYRDAVERIVAAEKARYGRSGELGEAVARALYKLMAYKDEYEVARLYTDGRFRERLHDSFEGDLKLSFHLAPPLFARRDPVTGRLRKAVYGPWMMKALRLLAPLKRLRGTWADPFGHSVERKTERRLIADYQETLTLILRHLGAVQHYDTLVALARLPLRIRGYGHVKEANLAAVQQEERALVASLERPAPLPVAAE